MLSVVATTTRRTRTTLLTTAALLLAGSGVVGSAGSARAEDTTFTNPTGLTSEFSDADVYPSSITVSGTGAPITGVQVTLNGLTSGGMSHSYVALVAPNGDAMMLLGKAGNTNQVTGVNLVLSDSAATFISQAAGPSSGTFKPSFYGPITFNPPGPGSSYAKPGPGGGNVATFASVFGGDLADGDWKLFVHNDGGGFSISGWALTISTARVPAPPAPDTALTKTPAKKVKTTKRKAAVTFRFSSPTAGAGFQCRLDDKAYVACASGVTVKAKIGKHTFAVRAVAGGVVDPTPASYTFKVKIRKKHR
jgi:hypothetical protein